MAPHKNKKNCWSEVQAASEENRRELNLQGLDINTRIEENGLDKGIFQLNNLNLLKIAGTPLTLMDSDIGNLKQLTSLYLENNKLEELPSTLGNLTSLKFLDISGNKLECLPDSLSNLINLQSLNANLNSLNSFPNVSGMKYLAYLSISRNQLVSLPEGVCDPNLTLLSTIDAAHNQIESIPSEISQLCHLIKFNVSNNKLDTLPLELCECPKLKELVISENKMKDRKFLKLADHSTKALLTHLSGLLEKQRSEVGKSKKGKSKGKKKGGKSEVEDLAKDLINVLKFNDALSVSVSPGAVSVRPYIVCCIIRNLDFFKSNNMFKRFITLQTKLHDAVCDKRQAATIATHDLRALKGPLVFDSADPKTICIVPLFKTKETTADVLMASLRSEAEEYRREKKRSAITGIHKYLDLLKGKTEYPYLRDNVGKCISLPPITNSELTKISQETTDILVEVTGSKSLGICKTVMEELLKATLLMGVGTSKSTTVADPGSENGAEGNSEECQDENAAAVGDSEAKETLTVEQVKVVDHEGRLRVLYPSKEDLLNPAFEVIRNYE